ncbi:protein SHQ1 homolog [Oculina patagonica]
MLTPVFELSQDDEFVVVIIKTPYVKIADVDFYINGTEFKFYVKPYFLRLNLPGEIVEDGRESASYDVDKGTFTIKLPKLHPGEPFEDLDLLTTLLAPKKKSPLAVKPLIEVVGSDSKFEDNNQENESDSDDDNDDDTNFNWEFEQQLTLSHQENTDISLGETKYGFANQKSGIFKGREAELHEISEITDPDSMTLSERREARLAAEDAKFDEEYYLADYFNEDQIQHLLDYKPPWDAECLQCKENLSKDKTEHTCGKEETTVNFTDEEKDQLRRLPNKDYLLDDKEELPLFLGLVDIIYAYAYNHRTTEGENTVESPWTISRISSTFSWFESFSSIHDVVISCARRSLSYPLYRHWSLVTAVIQDTKRIFSLGRRQVLKCLLEIHALCREEDPWFLLNELYLTDYCVWIQKVSRKKFSSLTQSLEQVQIHKSDLSWQLEELELAASLVQKEEQNDAQENTSESCIRCDSHEFEGDDDSTETDDDDDDGADDSDDDEDEDEDDDDDVDNEADDEDADNNHQLEDNDERTAVTDFKRNTLEPDQLLGSGSEKEATG